MKNIADITVENVAEMSYDERLETLGKIMGHIREIETQVERNKQRISDGSNPRSLVKDLQDDNIYFAERLQLFNEKLNLFRNEKSKDRD